MRIVHQCRTFGSHLKVIRPLKAILDRYHIRYRYKEDLESVISTFKYSIDFDLYEDEPHFAEVKKEVDKFDIWCQAGTIYEEAETLAADWFIIRTGQYQYPQPEAAFGYLKQTFDLTGYCDHCGIGKIQNRPFRLKTEPKQRNNQFWGLHWEFDALFVRQEAKNILEREGIRGIRFSIPVLHKTGSGLEGFYQLHFDTILDRGFNHSNTNVITCKINNEEDCNTDPGLVCCGRIKFHHPQIGGYHFDKRIFTAGPDAVQTAEFFGSGGSAVRLLIVSKRFKQIVEDLRLKGLSFIPVMHDLPAAAV